MTKRPFFRRRRHVARSARILSTGISATAILAMTAAYAAAEQVPTAVESSSTPVDSTVVTPSSIQGVAAPQPALAPLGVSPAATTAVARATSSPTTPATVAAKRPSTAAPQTAASNDTVAPSNIITPVVTLAPVDTVAVIAPVDTVAPVITVTPITAAPAPVQLQVPKSSTGSTSGGSR